VLIIVALLIMIFTSTTLSLYSKGEPLDPPKSFCRNNSSIFNVHGFLSPTKDHSIILNTRKNFDMNVHV
jgi:hypothetical protein